MATILYYLHYTGDDGIYTWWSGVYVQCSCHRSDDIRGRFSGGPSPPPWLVDALLPGDGGSALTFWPARMRWPTNEAGINKFGVSIPVVGVPPVL